MFFEDVIPSATGGLSLVDEKLDKADPFPEAFPGSGKTSKVPSIWAIGSAG